MAKEDKQESKKKQISDPKCRLCRRPVGKPGLRSKNAEERPNDVVKKGGKFYHELCLNP